MGRRINSGRILTVALCSLVAPPMAFGDDARVRVDGREWHVSETVHFRVHQLPGSVDDQLPALCESLRAHLVDAWVGSAPTWREKCDVFVHASRTEYVRTLGRGVGSSVGCATTKVDGRRVVMRRIDVRRDASGWQDDALPHEMTHVVLADRFAGRTLPLWADEGMGVLAESRAKQRLRREALERSRKRGLDYSPRSLTATTVPRGDRVHAFYGRSAALVEHLTRRSTPRAFVDFVELALDRGYDTALRETYGLAGLAAIDAEWSGIEYRAIGLDALLARADEAAPRDSDPVGE